jgi:hypothetical protein
MANSVVFGGSIPTDDELAAFVNLLNVDQFARALIEVVDSAIGKSPTGESEDVDRAA